MPHRIKITFYSILLLTAVAVTACDKTPQHRATLLGGNTMGTSWAVKITDLPQNVDLTALNSELETELETINASMSTYLEDSEISRINKLAANNPFRTSDRLYAVLSEAERVSLMSGGAFDISVGPLVNLWGFGPSQSDSVPHEESIKETLKFIGTDKFVISPDDRSIVKNDDRVYLDLSAIAKGYGVDRLGEILEQQHIENYMVEIGGELKLRGINERGTPWVIAVEKPNPNERSPLKLVQPGQAAIATSGDYRNYFERDGVRYSHTIDPSTGYPITHKLASVSVIHEQCTTADALATALMVLGPEAGIELAERENIAAFFIIKSDNGFTTHTTEQYRPYLTQP